MNRHRTFSSRRKRGTVKRVLGKIDRGNREIWRVVVDGQVQNLATAASSIRAMEQALVIYGGALNRLADR